MTAVTAPRTHLTERLGGIVRRGVEWVPRERMLVLFFTIGASAAFRELQIGSIHLFTILAAIAGVSALVTRRRSTVCGEAGLLVVCVVLFASTAITGLAVVNALLAVQLILLTGSAVAIAISLTTERMDAAARGLLAGASLSSLVGVLQQVRIIPAELYSDSSGLSRPMGLVGEPDWMGAFAAVAIIILLRGVVKSPWVLVPLLAVNGAALVLSFARAAWLGLAVSLIAALVFAWGGGQPHAFALRVRREVVILLGVAVVAAIFVPGLVQTFVTRVLSIFSEDHRDKNAVYRLQQFDGLWHMVDTAPWNGHGISASGRVTDLGIYHFGPLERAVPSNWVFGVLAEGMWLGVPLILALLVLAFVRGRGLAGQILIFVLVNSLFSNLLYSPITWLAIGGALCMDGSRERKSRYDNLNAAGSARTPA